MTAIQTIELGRILQYKSVGWQNQRNILTLHCMDGMLQGVFFLVTSSYKLKWEPFSGSGMDGKGLLKAAVFTYWVWSPGVTRKELRPQIIMSHCNKKVLFSLLGFLTSSTLSTMLPLAGKLAGRPAAVQPHQHRLQFEPVT